MSTPQSTIKVCSGVRLNPSYEHTIYFDSLSAQSSYFEGKVAKTFSSYTFLRKSWSIKVQATMDIAKSWSYLFFRNAGNQKTYYYFITNIEYVNDATVELFLELDVMQTYLFDYQLLDSFVEREHSDTDEIGDNVIDEGLELGEFIVNAQENVDLSTLCILVLSTYNPINTTEENTDTTLAARYNGVFSGLGVYAVNMTDWIAWGTKLNMLDSYGKSDGIVSMWMYPKNLVALADGEEWDDGSVTKAVGSVKTMTETYSRNTTINGFTPRNNKLFTYPYNFLYVSNNSGGASAYHYERFTNANALKFKVSGSLSPDGSAVMYPVNYNGATNNYEEGITLKGFPTCAWNQDVYKMWLAQNQTTQELGLVGGALMVGAGVAGTLVSGGILSGVGGGAIAGGASIIASTLASRHDKAIQPPQARGSFSASVNTAQGYQTFTVQKKSVDARHAKIIDDYFTMYGYKTNRLKKPNRNVRQNWTYTKTVGCHVSGNLCTDDLIKIESIYDKGITFWKNGDSIGDYSLSNMPNE